MFKKLLSGLFGSQGGGNTSTGTKAAEPVEYKEYLIISQPDNELLSNLVYDHQAASLPV